MYFYAAVRRHITPFIIIIFYSVYASWCPVPADTFKWRITSQLALIVQTRECNTELRVLKSFHVLNDFKKVVPLSTLCGDRFFSLFYFSGYERFSFVLALLVIGKSRLHNKRWYMTWPCSRGPLKRWRFLLVRKRPAFTRNAFLSFWNNKSKAIFQT